MVKSKQLLLRFFVRESLTLCLECFSVASEVKFTEGAEI